MYIFILKRQKTLQDDFYMVVANIQMPVKIDQYEYSSVRFY